jgi:hypothetical protein
MQKNLVTLITLIALGGFISFCPTAQGADGKVKKNKATATEQATKPKAAAENRLARLSKALNLTADQQQQTKEIFKEEAKELKQIRQDTSLDQEKKKTKVEQIRTATNGKIANQLTPEQKVKWDKMQARRQQGQERPKAKKNV